MRERACRRARCHQADACRLDVAKLTCDACTALESGAATQRPSVAVGSSSAGAKAKTQPSRWETVPAARSTVQRERQPRFG